MSKVSFMLDPGWRELLALVRCASRAISGIAFSEGHLSALLILIASALCPQFLICGALALVAAWILARFLGFSTQQLETAGILRNAFLTGLSVAWISLYWEWTPAKWPWLALGAGGMAMVLSTAAEYTIGKILPPMNAGFLVAASALFTIHGGKNLADPSLVHDAILVPEPTWLPETVLTFLRAFGVICFLPNASIGLIIALAVLVRSRLTLWLGLAGLLGGLWANHSFQYLAPWTFDAGIFVYNALLAGMAIGSYFVASRATCVLAFVAGAFSMFLWHAITAFFAYWAAAQILSISFLAATWVVLAAMRQRAGVGTLLPLPFAGMQPEIAAAQAAEYSVRFPAAGVPVLDLPFVGVRVVTQSQDGEITHRGAWRHAVDFEVQDAAGRAAPPGSGILDAFYTFGAAILSPISGTVVKVINDVPDNKIGETNYEQNWGNLAVIQSPLGFHVLLAHFRQHSIVVFRGQWIEAGQYLGQCGNSGRSPIPHLHVHCQKTAEPGDPTIPFTFRNYVLHADTGGEWRQFGFPVCRERVERFEADPAATALLQAWKPGKTQYAWISPEGKTLRRTLEVSFADDGCWQFRVPEESAECKGCVINSGLRLFDLRAKRVGFLSGIFFALSSVPFASDRRLEWRENLPDLPIFMGRRGLRLPRSCVAVKRRSFPMEETGRLEVSAQSDRISAVAMIVPGGGLSRLVLDTPAGRWTASAITSTPIQQLERAIKYDNKNARKTGCPRRDGGASDCS